MSAPGCHRRVHDERGAVAVEVVLLVPVLILVLCMLVAGWRVWSARTQVDDAAAAAARAATLETSASQAQVRALRAAHTNLEALGVHCEPETTSVDTSGFGTPPGTPAEVSATITCGIALDDLILPGLPGHWQVHAVRTHPMDTFRERRP